MEILQKAIKLLCMVCSARKTQFYIPGETNLSERLRKRAFDSGTFTLLTYIYNELRETDKDPFATTRDHIKEQVLNYATITDLTYHAKLMNFLLENPQLTESTSKIRLNQTSAMEERKDDEASTTAAAAALLSSNSETMTTMLTKATE